MNNEHKWINFKFLFYITYVIQMYYWVFGYTMEWYQFLPIPIFSFFFFRIHTLDNYHSHTAAMYISEFNTIDFMIFKNQCKYSDSYFHKKIIKTILSLVFVQSLKKKLVLILILTKQLYFVFKIYLFRIINSWQQEIGEIRI